MRGLRYIAIYILDKWLFLTTEPGIQYCDTELLQLVGKKGIKEILKAIEASRKDRANGFVGYTLEEVFEEVNKAIKEVEINGI